MRKHIIQPNLPDTVASGTWLDIERLAQVEISSEEPSHPIEGAIGSGTGLGWRAAQPGRQILRLLFDERILLRRIRLVFSETIYERTQELLLRWSSDGGATYRDIVRQQYNFSPPTTTKEVEEFVVNLQGATTLELTIVPDVRGGTVIASLQELRLA
jgi:hypothetical protein